MRILLLTAAAIAVLNGLQCGSAVADELPVGIVASQPASGRFVKTDQGYMVPYEATIPTTNVKFLMTPIPGGAFKLGSGSAEAGRSMDEGPQVLITVRPFWMAVHEITWGEYQSYMEMNRLIREIDDRKLLPITDANRIDVVTAPSAPYDEATLYGFGREARRPAIMMRQYAAKQYTKWLSGLSERFYRLPTEVEWEYACRAGATTAYSFGNDPALVGEYAWFAKNSKESTQLVGQKKPNPWGLHDMHGNVAEWVIDGYEAEAYAELAKKQSPLAADAAIRWPTKIFPRVVRGGSWDDEPKKLRSAARLGSDEALWLDQDPCVPQSPWWFTSHYSLGVGFRIIRPLAVPKRETQEKFWRADVKLMQEEIDLRIEQEGRGKKAAANGELRKVLEKMKAE